MGDKAKKRALISVYDKSGIEELAQFLAGAGWEILSTGGTSRFLLEKHIPVTDVSSVTGFPECLDGRVKTLHPAIHAGILARREEPSHMDTLEKLGFSAIELVCVNLYPFFEKVQAGLGIHETIEFIDIGGPAMLRSAAKNHRDVIVLSDSSDYEKTIEFIKSGLVPETHRKYLAGKVFALTSAYDAAVARYLLDIDQAIGGNSADINDDVKYPHFWPLSLEKSQQLRYGENNHQSAALYLSADKKGALGGMEQLSGKELGYNNIRDLDLAWKAVCAFGKEDFVQPEINFLNKKQKEKVPVCVAVKHNTPCGIAGGSSLIEAYEKTYICDPLSIYGGIVACNVKIDAATAEKLAELFLEIVVAPEFDEEALAILKGKKNLRIMKAQHIPEDKTECIAVDGGLLVQSSDRTLLERWDVVTQKTPEDGDIEDMIFGLRSVSFVKSNAIVVVKDLSAVGIGGGQTNRIWAARQALERSAEAIKSAKENPSLSGKGIADGKSARIMASDAFFPFADVVEAAREAGIKAIIQPGGSIRDKESIEACDKFGIAMVFTGTRHFKH